MKGRPGVRPGSGDFSAGLWHMRHGTTPRGPAFASTRAKVRCYHASNRPAARMDEPAFSHALDAVYAAATSFDRWPAALAHFERTFDCSYVGLIQRNLRTMEGRAVALGIDAAGQRDYFNYWSKHDIFMQKTSVFRPGAVETDRDLLPRAELLRSDYYNGFHKPRDMHAYLRITLSQERGFRKIISLARPVALGDFAAADIEHCRRLVPHLQRAARVAQHIDEARLMFDAFSDVLERSDRGVLILEASGKVVFANAAARTMAATADGFRLRRDRIEVLDRKADAALLRLVAGAAGQFAGTDAARGGTLRLPRESGRPDYAVAVGPLGHDSAWSNVGPNTFVLITDPDANPARAATLIAQLFGLSAAETRVAERLMMGESPEQAATSLGIKTSTARWHLAALYRKTGTNRQAQLTRLLLSVPAIRISS